MVSAPSSRSSSLGQAVAVDIVMCSWARYFTATKSHSTLVCKWVLANLRLKTVPWTSINPGGSRNTLSCLIILLKLEMRACLIGHLVWMQT